MAPRTRPPSYYQTPNKSEPQHNVVKAKQPPPRAGVSTRTAQLAIYYIHEANNEELAAEATRKLNEYRRRQPRVKLRAV